MQKYITKESKTRLLLLAALFFSCLFIFRQYLFGDSVLVFDDVGGDTWQQYTMYYADIVNHLHAGNFSFWDFTNGIGSSLFTMLQADPSLILICLIGVALGPAHMLYYLVVLQILKILAAGSDSEKALQLELSKFNSVMETAFEECAPHKICAYIYDLANAFNKFYHETKILATDDMEAQSSWISLLLLTRRVLETCIDMLGFEAPEKM